MNAAKRRGPFSFLGFCLLGVATLVVVVPGCQYKQFIEMVVYHFNDDAMQGALTPAQAQGIASAVENVMAAIVQPLIITNVAWMVAFLVMYFRLKSRSRPVA